MASRWRQLIPFRGGRKEAASRPSKHKDSLDAPAQGLKVVAEGEQPVIDIVAVHGLNGHRDKTWTAANGVHWLRGLLPHDIPNARAFCWGYDANTHGDRVSCQYLYDHARQLVSDLCLERRLTKTMQRPIIFVAHSLGGIIVKSALIHSDAARKGALEEHRSIKTSTYGIIFMGTPHQGGSGAQLGKLLVNVASVFVAADDHLLRHLERDSEWLQQQLGQYNPISGEFVTKFVYEEYKTPTALGHSILVVPKASAVVPGTANAEPIAIHADHINIARFASKEDSGYQTVSGHLRIMAESASDAIGLRWAEEHRVETARINSEETFSIVFSLSEASETEGFVARQDELTVMHKTLCEGKGRRAVTLHGLGGIGKTQLAIAYIKDHRDDYSAIIWLNIKDEVSVKQSYSRVARRILQEHPLARELREISDESKPDEVVAAVRRWLDHAKNTRWLMVFDNYDNPKVASNKDPGVVDIREFLPEAHHGSVIVTTRSSKVNMGRRIKVGKLQNIGDSLQILSNASRREGVTDDLQATELAKELDGLPLALATAGAYLDQVAISFADYLRLYRASWLKLQQTSPNPISYEDHTLYSTWQLSFDHIKGQSELSANLLQLWAYFDNEDLWFDLLQHCDVEDPKWIQELTEDELSFHAAVRVLIDHGLVEVDASSKSWNESRGYSVHSCVHMWITFALNQGSGHHLAKLALKFVGSHVPDETNSMKWLTEQRLIHHAARCVHFVLNGWVSNDGVEWELHRLGVLYQDYGKLDEAEKVWQQALQGYEKIVSPDHPWLLDMFNHLGLLYTAQGKRAEAENMYMQALQGREETLGPEHPLTLGIVNNLGLLYVDQGRLDEAEKMYERSIQGYEKASGSDYMSTFCSMNNLGLLYETQGKLDEAEKTLQLARQGYEKAYGPDHTSTFMTVMNLGTVYESQHKLNEAEKMYQRALQGYTKILGPEHASTLKAANILGNFYENHERLEEAEKMYQRALQGYEETLGPNHKSTLQTVFSLGVLYANQSKLDEAENMYQRALQGYKRVWGLDYKFTMDIVNNLGLLYKSQGKLDEAENMYQRALQGKETGWGPNHTSTLNTVDNLGSLYESLGRLDEAEKMYLRALVGREKALGPDHLSTLNTVDNLGKLYRDRCYIIWQESTVLFPDTNPNFSIRTDFLRNVDALEELYSKFPTTFLSDSLGRVYLWAGRDSDAVTALRRYIDCVCDGCKIDLHTIPERFVCGSCRDCDLCRGCYEKYGEEGFVSSRLDCRHHRFLYIAVSSS